jgi:hypothetical protein
MRVAKEARVLFILLVVVTILQFAFARRHSLWADEFFSLAMATGHSLEHRVANAQPQLGDFIEPQGPVPAAEFRRYLQHGSWVGQLGNRHVPKSLQTLAQGRSRILLVKLHEVRAPAPEEDWLRANASMVNQKHIQTIELIDFQPKTGATF